MARISIRCPKCNQSYKASEESLGQRVRCKRCEAVFEVSREKAPSSIDMSPTSGRRQATAAKVETKVPQEVSSDRKPVETFGRFEIRKLVGAGGFGKVYRAFDPVLNREVALKVPLSSAQENMEMAKRLEREAQSAGQLRHPNIVPIYDAGFEGEQFYIASAFIEGQTLSQALKSGQIDIEHSVEIIRQLAEALAYAHEQGIIHRDIKPHNVMLEKSGVPHLMDFGLARLEDSREQLTHDGTLLGTPVYMSPEQASRGKGDEVGPASDQYSLGVVMYELLCGERPFEGPVEVVLYKVLKEDPRSPRAVKPIIPKDLETVCLKAMSKELGSRYFDCQAFADDLRRWSEGEPIHARRVNSAERFIRWTKRNPVLAVLTSASIALLVLVAIVATIGYQQTSRALALEAAARQRADDAVLRVEEALQVESIALKAKDEALQKETEALQAKDEALREETIARERAEQAERTAETEARNAVKLADIMVTLLEVPDPYGFGDLNPRQIGEDEQSDRLSRRIVEIGVERAQTELTDQPLVRARLLATLGNVYRGLAQHDKARELLQDALALQRDEPNENQLGEAKTLVLLSNLAIDLRKFEEAEKYVREAIEIHEGQPKDSQQRVEAALKLSWILYNLNRSDEAKSVTQQAAKDYGKLLGEQGSDLGGHLATIMLGLDLIAKRFDYIESLPIYNDLATFFFRLARDPEGEDIIKEVSRMMQLRMVGNDESSWKSSMRSLELCESRLGDAHPFVGCAKMLFAIVAQSHDQEKEESLYQGAVETLSQSLGDHGYTSMAYYLFARYLRLRDRWDEAEKWNQEAVRIGYTSPWLENYPKACLIAVEHLQRILEHQGKQRQADAQNLRLLALHLYSLHQPGNHPQATVFSGAATEYESLAENGASTSAILSALREVTSLADNDNEEIRTISRNILDNMLPTVLASLDERAQRQLSQSFEALSGNQIEGGIRTLAAWTQSLRRANQDELAQHFDSIRNKLVSR